MNATEHGRSGKIRGAARRPDRDHGFLHLLRHPRRRNPSDGNPAQELKANLDGYDGEGFFSSNVFSTTAPDTMPVSFLIVFSGHLHKKEEVLKLRKGIWRRVAALTAHFVV